MVKCEHVTAEERLMIANTFTAICAQAPSANIFSNFFTSVP